MKICTPALTLGLIAAPILTALAESSNGITNDSPSRMQRLTRRTPIDLTSSSSTFARRNATTFVPRQDKVDSTVSNSTTSTIGDVVDSHRQESESANIPHSPYLVANALRLLHEGVVVPAKEGSVIVKRGDDDDQKMSTTSEGDAEGEDEDCDEEEEDDEDAGECDSDDEDEDAEDCVEDADGEGEEDCDDQDDSEDGSEGNVSPIGGGVGFVAINDPSNLAKGSLKGSEGCTKFATVVSGDTCYKLIKAKDDALLKTFYRNNPSVDSGCQNLEINSAYCVSSAPVTSPTTTEPTKEAVKEEQKPTQTPKSDSVKEEKSVTEEPKQETTQQSKPTSSPTKQPVKTDDGKGTNKKADYSGKASYYYQNGNAGACGNKKSDSDYIVALHPALYNNGARCGEKISLTNKATGKTLIAEVQDLCPTCEDKQVDLSKGLFDALSNGADGIFQVEYGFL